MILLCFQLVSLDFFNWYLTIDIFFEYSYTFYIYVCFQLQIVSISIGIKFSYIYICFICAYYISISLSTNFGYAKLDFLNDFYFNWLFFNWYLIQAYASFCLVFHKGGENSYFTFQLVLLFYSHTLCSKWFIYLQLVLKLVFTYN